MMNRGGVDGKLGKATFAALKKAGLEGVDFTKVKNEDLVAMVRDPVAYAAKQEKNAALAAVVTKSGVDPKSLNIGRDAMDVAARPDNAPQTIALLTIGKGAGISVG
jgi:hypothetical protein